MLRLSSTGRWNRMQRKSRTDRALTRTHRAAIDRIEVSRDKQITVRYRFQSEFETYAEVLNNAEIS